MASLLDSFPGFGPKLPDVLPAAAGYIHVGVLSRKDEDEEAAEEQAQQFVMCPECGDREREVFKNGVVAAYCKPCRRARGRAHYHKMKVVKWQKEQSTNQNPTKT